MKKRVLAMLLAASCTFAMVSGCATPSGTLGGNDDPAPANSASAGGETSCGEMQPRVLTLASQSVDSTAYARCSALASVMNNYLPDGWSVEVSPVSTDGAAGTLLGPYYRGGGEVPSPVSACALCKPGEDVSALRGAGSAEAAHRQRSRGQAGRCTAHP